MRLRWRRVRESPDRVEAREAREAAERRLRSITHTVIVPLQEARRENHVSPRLEYLIQRAARQRGEA